MFNRFTGIEASCDRSLKRTNAFAIFCYVCALNSPCYFDTAPPWGSLVEAGGKVTEQSEPLGVHDTFLERIEHCVFLLQRKQGKKVQYLYKNWKFWKKEPLRVSMYCYVLSSLYYWTCTITTTSFSFTSFLNDVCAMLSIEAHAPHYLRHTSLLTAACSAWTDWVAVERRA